MNDIFLNLIQSYSHSGRTDSYEMIHDMLCEYFKLPFGMELDFIKNNFNGNENSDISCEFYSDNTAAIKMSDTIGVSNTWVPDLGYQLVSSDYKSDIIKMCILV
jgi:hypothetical protein